MCLPRGDHIVRRRGKLLSLPDEHLDLSKTQSELDQDAIAIRDGCIKLGQNADAGIL